MTKFWYFTAVIFTENYAVYYDGYVDSKDFFPVNTAKVQAVNYAKTDLPQDFDKKTLLSETMIINQVEVTGGEYDVWKENRGF